MRTWLPYALAASVGLLVTASADDIGKKVTDPVSNKTVTVAKDTPSVIVNANAVYFADANSRAAFLKSPETYLTRAKTKLECPVKGFPSRANKANRVVVNDQIVYFCCAGCPQEFDKEPNNFLEKVKDPVSGNEFSVSAESPKATYKGNIYFFENADSKAAFEKEPAKFAKVLIP
jgi:YHS domain-containing protein